MIFCFKIIEKRNIEFIGEEMVKFTPIVSLYFEPGLSNGSEHDLITILNIPVAV